MIQLTKRLKQEWHKSLGTEGAKAVFAFMRESVNRPKIDTSAQMQPHHIQMQAGIQVGWDKCLDTLEALARDNENKTIDDETPSLVSTHR